jgi:hypothetical protein
MLEEKECTFKPKLTRPRKKQLGKKDRLDRSQNLG